MVNNLGSWSVLSEINEQIKKTNSIKQVILLMTIIYWTDW